MQPDPSQTDRLRLLLYTAAALDSVEQRAFLQAACSDNPVLVDELIETITISDSTPDLDSLADALPPIASGDVLGDRFHIVRQLGEAGMASVYEAIDSKLMERRALKFPKPGYGRRIPDEARAALRVTHENICRTHEIHTTPATDFISMELLDGETLYARFRRQPLTLDESL